MAKKKKEKEIGLRGLIKQRTISKSILKKVKPIKIRIKQELEDAKREMFWK